MIAVNKRLKVERGRSEGGHEAAGTQRSGNNEGIDEGEGIHYHTFTFYYIFVSVKLFYHVKKRLAEERTV